MEESGSVVIVYMVTCNVKFLDFEWLHFPRECAEQRCFASVPSTWSFKFLNELCGSEGYLLKACCETCIGV